MNHYSVQHESGCVHFLGLFKFYFSILKENYSFQERISLDGMKRFFDHVFHRLSLVHYLIVTSCTEFNRVSLDCVEFFLPVE